MPLTLSSSILRRACRASAWLLLALGGAPLGAVTLNLTQVYALPGTGWSNHDAEWADFDGDGRLDLALANTWSSASNPGLQILRNTGGDNFSQAWVSPYPSENLSAVAVGDFDGDGDPDLAAAGASGPLRFFRNDGGFSFSLFFTGPTAYYEDAEFGDLDGDGDLDLAVADSTLGGARLFQNTGSGFTSAFAVAINGNDTGLSLGDFDNDGDLDFIQSVTGWGNQIWRNNGGFNFTWAFTLPWSNANDSKFADMDGDGDLDVVVATANGAPGPAKLYRNNGDLTFTFVWQGVEADEDRGMGVALGDLNGDGLPEIVLASYVFDSWLHVYGNLGGLAFDKPYAWASPGSPQMPALGDYDGDGDLDIALAQNGYSSHPGAYVWRNDHVFLSPTITPTCTVTRTPTLSPSFTHSPTISPTFSQSQTFTISATFTPSPVVSPTRTASATRSPTPTPVAAPCGAVAWPTPGATHAVRGLAVGPGGAMAVGLSYVSAPAAYFLAGLDASANGLWARVEIQSPGPWGDEAYGVAADSSGYIVAGTGDDIGYSSASMRLSRYAADGTLLWRRMWRDTQHSWGKAAAARDGQAALIGESAGPSGAYQIRVLAYDSLGNLRWNRSWLPPSGTGSGLGNAGAYSACGELWVGGYYTGGSSVEGVLLRYDAEGNLMQSLLLGGANSQQVQALAAAPGGGVVAGLEDNGGVRLLLLDAFGAVTRDIVTGQSAVRGVAQDREGGLLAGGTCSVFPCVKRYRPDGSLDWTWQLSIVSGVTAMALQPDGSLLVAYNTNSSGGGATVQRLCPPLPLDAGLSPACPSATPSPSASPTPSDSPTVTVTATVSPTPSDSPTGTASATVSPTASVTGTSTGTPTPTPSRTASGTATPTPSVTATLTQTESASPTPTATQSPVPSATTTHSPTPTASPTLSGTHSASPSETPSATRSPTLSATPTYPGPVFGSTRTPTPTPTFSPAPRVPTGDPLQVLALYPNPFSETQKLWVRCRGAGRLTLRAFNVAGEEVLRRQEAVVMGDNALAWDGSNAGGLRLASGIYLLLLRLDADSGESGEALVTSALQR